MNRQNSLVCSSTFSILDGIPFKIGPKFKPPTQLVEAPVLNVRQSSGVDAEYDFSTEEGVLKWAEVRQKQRVAQQLAEAEKEAQREAMDVSSESEEEAEEEHMEVVPPQQEAVNTSVVPKPLPKPVLANISNDILTPVPINKSSNEGGQEKTENSVDVTLFESVDDPFDKFERQTLNDIEELKNVFASTDKPAAASGNVSSVKGNMSETSEVVCDNASVKMENGHIPNGIVTAVNHLSTPDDIDSGDYVAIDPKARVSPKSKKKKRSSAEYKNLPPVPPRPSLLAKNPLPPIGGSSGTDSTPKIFSDQMNSDVQQEVVSSAQSVIPTQLPCSTNHTGNEPEYQNGHNTESVEIDGHTSVAFSKREPIVRNSSPQSFAVMADSEDKPLNHKYVNVAPKPAVPPRPADGLVKRGPAFSQGINSPTNEDSDEDLLPISLRQIPLVRPSSQQENANVPTSSSESSWNKYTPLPTPRTGLSPPVTSPSSKSSGSSDMASPGEIDPYLRLPGDAQCLVDSVVSMGFSRPRVARAVERIGTDEKEVIEHLCLVNKLSEKGFDAYLAETTLITYKNNVEKSEIFLSLYKQFQELGFTGDRIKDALIQNELDSEKALDQLTS